ncbi:hypothetical protein [Schlesneria sp. DSM 10557]|uniref:hypothetical protein n=1 Tax=Schlesneria sp. DSM 10557 TaxID=3044399 RepID=UPI00359FD29F
MAFHLQYRETRWGSWVDVDLEANGVAIKRLLISYSSAARLDWYVTANETTAPIPRLAWVRLWDDTGVDEEGDPQTSTNPLFLGRITDVSPGSHANQVLYVAMDPTYWAAKQVAVMSLPYDVGDIPSAEPQGYVGSVPRLVYNVKNTADEDYSYSAGNDGDVGQIIAGLLEYCYQPLYWLDAAPGDGSDAGNDVPYWAADLAPMDFVPQQKCVWESLTIRAAVEQMWRHEPRFRMLWHPASKRWRFHQITQSPAVEITLNDTGLVTEYPCVGLDIKPSYEDCVTAVSIYGPPSNVTEVFYWDDTLSSLDGTNLEPVGSPIVLENYSTGSGPDTAETYNCWRIYDPFKRPGARTLPDWISMPMSQYYSVAGRFPSFQMSWDYGDTWYAVANVWFDFLAGTVNFIGTVPYTTISDSRGQSIIPASTQTVFPPVACRLYWAPFDPPLSVRYPSSGHAGTAYTVAGMTNEYRLYDESLAIGKEYGVPVTSSARRAQFEKLAQYLHESRCDVIYTGNAVLAGIDYSWCRLNKRVNFADAAGTTTGWEDINAVVTDVEYTFGDTPSTTLTFNANWMELYGEDAAHLRERLRIEAFEQRKSEFPQITLIMQRYTTYFGNQVNVQQGAIMTYETVYKDRFGNVQRAEGRR